MTLEWNPGVLFANIQLFQSESASANGSVRKWYRGKKSEAMMGGAGVQGRRRRQSLNATVGWGNLLLE